ncbi:MAG TPA: hypothetical protein VMU06_04690 [Stellaceae bacterium]|nr:hypothetical protein [Stellaceae bacterium]
MFGSRTMEEKALAFIESEIQGKLQVISGAAHRRYFSSAECERLSRRITQAWNDLVASVSAARSQDEIAQKIDAQLANYTETSMQALRDLKVRRLKLEYFYESAFWNYWLAYLLYKRHPQACEKALHLMAALGASVGVDEFQRRAMESILERHQQLSPGSIASTKFGRAEINCPNCGEHLSLPRAQYGSVTCPTCNKDFKADTRAWDMFPRESAIPTSISPQIRKLLSQAAKCSGEPMKGQRLVGMVSALRDSLRKYAPEVTPEEMEQLRRVQAAAEEGVSLDAILSMSSGDHTGDGL